MAPPFSRFAAAASFFVGLMAVAIAAGTAPLPPPGPGNGKTVAIIGGGIGGLSAALELAERGFSVQVYDRQAAFGGKARSIPYEGSGTDGRDDWEGEHGFRFFAGFYYGTRDTMSRIPSRKGSVEDRLLVATHEMLAQIGGKPFVFPSKPPDSKGEFWKDLASLVHVRALGVPVKEMMYWFERLMVLLSSCRARWSEQYDEYKYWDFFHAEELSEPYGKYLVSGVTRNIVAAKAEVASLKTLGQTFMRLIHHTFLNHLDQILDGPTNEAFIDPWVARLTELGVEFFPNHEAVGLALDQDGRALAHVEIQGPDGPGQVTADYYVLAIPGERMAPLVDAALAQAAPSLSHLADLKFEWMNGIQYYVNKDVSLVFGHVGYFDSPWALTSVSQQQLWPDIDVSGQGNGRAVDILSVDISDWNTPGLPGGPAGGKTAKQCTVEEIAAETWFQLSAHLPDDIPADMDSTVIDYFFDPDIIFDGPGATRGMTNEEPLLVNLVGTARLRPSAATEVANLFLAADYVTSDVDVACMEAANEAARRAANAVLEADGVPPDVEVFEIPWPKKFSKTREKDCIRMAEGKMPKGWDFPVPKPKADGQTDAQYALMFGRWIRDMMRADPELYEEIGEFFQGWVELLSAHPDAGPSATHLASVAEL